MNEWVVLELSQKSEGEDPEALRAGILGALKQPVEVFIPAAVTQISGDRKIHYLMEGYAFVRRDLPDNVYLRLEGSRFVQSVLTKPNGSRYSRILATVNDAHIDRLRGQIEVEVNQGIGVGDTVTITSGPYKHINATVIEEIPEQDAVQVYVKLRSKESIITMPRGSLQISTRSPMSPLLARLGLLRTWIQKADPVFEWPDGFDTVQRTFDDHARLDAWTMLYVPRRRFTRFWDRPLEVFGFQNRIDEIEKLSGWLTAAAPHTRFMKADRRISGLDNSNRPLDMAFDPLLEESVPPSMTFSILEASMLELAWFEDILERGRRVRDEMHAILKKMATRRRTGVGKVPQNIIVDGFNLACRCASAPGLSELKDSQGRPTGAIIGFLNSLGSLKKRYPGSAFYVTWDGSSRRRKDKYPDYKANRNKIPIAFEVEQLRKILPCIGVYQAFNPNEEADDVIATLVRKKLSGQRTVIFSSDRDFLQLVSEWVSVLLPAIGSRKELMCDTPWVKEHYGVDPSAMVQLRALTGDASDNLPGVPRVPKKVLKSLVQAHGTVEGLYRSGLAGVTKVQYERLRSAEPQVKINIDLMTLRDISFTKIDPTPNPDEVAALLRAVEINPNPILETFLERASELATGLTL